MKVSQEACSKIVKLTDAGSLITVLANINLPAYDGLLFQLSHTRQVALQWKPVHCGIFGNTKANELAKLRAKNIHPLNKISYDEKAMVIRTVMNELLVSPG